MTARVIPIECFRKPIVNAVVHRDYDIGGSQIIIRLFPDHIEFQNPGTLYNTLTVENLYAGASLSAAISSSPASCGATRAP